MEQSLKRHKVVPLWQGPIVKTALAESFKKLDPRHLAKNPVMFVVEVGSAVTTWFYIQGLRGGAADAGFAGHITLWLWFTVLFANFAEAMAEGRGKAQAETLRSTKTKTLAKRLRGAEQEKVWAGELRKGDVVLVETGDIIPADGEVVEGIASVDESAVTGESAPVIRESGGDRSSVTGGTRVNSDWIKVRVTANPGEGFLDKMISLVEGAERQKTPNEIALNILLAGLTLIFLIVLMSLQAFAVYSGGAVSVVTLVALLVCLIPTTIGGLLSAIGIAGIDRLMQSNVLAMSGRAVEAAGDVDCLLLDKTGTITLGNRMAAEFMPAPGVTLQELALDAQLSSLSDETPEGRSIVVLAKQFVPKPTALHEQGMIFVPFTAQTRLSGVDIGPVTIRKGAVDAVAKLVDRMPPELAAAVERISKSGGTPLAVARDGTARGVIHLKDVVKGGIRQRFEQLRAMGIRTVMITGDNPLTAAAIAAESGVDDFLAQATPEKKLSLIRLEQG
ncbi:MAG: potassium-transporting ATPase subunit KdpB, partial [Elusimicrobia bacterium]|nr:potassium-transporting ATPase subunit KdpB [Elusimicrobiota bacterium]